MKLQVTDYKPEEISVKISNNLVTIEGKQEMREENNFSSKSFSKMFSIPAGVKPENITCSFYQDGSLMVTAPIDQQHLQQQQQQQIVESQQGSQVTQSTKKVSQTFSSSTSTSSSSQQQEKQQSIAQSQSKQ